jgi:hypothetical protein
MRVPGQRRSDSGRFVSTCGAVFWQAGTRLPKQSETESSAEREEEREGRLTTERKLRSSGWSEGQYQNAQHWPGWFMLRPHIAIPTRAAKISTITTVHHVAVIHAIFSLHGPVARARARRSDTKIVSADGALQSRPSATAVIDLASRSTCPQWPQSSIDTTAG